MAVINWLSRFSLCALMALAAYLGFAYGRDGAWEFLMTNYDSMKELIGVPEGFKFRYVLGGIAGVIWLVLFVTLLPKRRREREVSFRGSHGDVTIALEPVEATLKRVVSKLPDVKSIEITIKPLEGPGKVRVLAKAVLYKDAESDARMITARVNNFIRVHTRKIIGIQDIDTKLDIKRFVMRMKTVKPEMLLLEAPEENGGSGSDSVQSSPPAQTESNVVRAEVQLDEPGELEIERY